MKVEIPMNFPGFLMAMSMIVPWVLGIAVAKGFWITVGCVLIPPMAWVILAQHFLT
jgi:hypothetical protein